MKRTRLKPMSDKRRRAIVDHAEIRAAVFERDHYLCRLALVPGAGLCFGQLTPHHIVKASQGGAYSVDNLASLCAFHNSELEANADLARLAEGLGLVVRRSA